MKITSDTEWPAFWKCSPTDSFVFWWHVWTMVFLWPQKRCSAVWPVSPQYWGISGHVLSFFEHDRMYRRLLELQVNWPLMSRFSPVLLILTFFWTSPLSMPVKGHSLQLALPRVTSGVCIYIPGYVYIPFPEIGYVKGMYLIEKVCKTAFTAMFPG